jgi:hypothetical protein
MAPGTSGLKRFGNWTVEIRVWKFLVVMVIAAMAWLWFRVVHQDDEILALVRNEVLTDGTGQRTWAGSFVNTNDRTLRDVAVTVEFIDSGDRTVGKKTAVADELPFSARLDLQAPLPAGAARMRIHSVQWRMGSKAALMGPFREPWEFGYLMVDPAKVTR